MESFDWFNILQNVAPLRAEWRGRQTGRYNRNGYVIGMDYLQAIFRSSCPIISSTFLSRPALQEIVPRFLPSESTSTVPTRSLTKLKRARTERKGQASIYLHSLSCCFACCLALLCIYRSRPAIHSTIHKDGQSLSCVHHLINNSVGLFQWIYDAMGRTSRERRRMDR